MIHKTFMLGSILFLMLVTSAWAMGDETLSKGNIYPWTSYIGVQSSEPVPWAGLSRGMGRGVTGIHLTAHPAFPELDKNPDFVTLRAQVVAFPPQKQIIIPLGGLGSGRNQARVNAFMAMVEADSGAQWRALVEAQAQALTPDVKNWSRTYWQIGNEINSRHFAQTLRAWAGLPPRKRHDDFGLIPYYVEYFLAPSVAGLRAASSEITGGKDTRIVLGTIANAFRGSSREWLNTLLSYEVEGTFAPSLKGQRVSQLVDIVAVHYLVSQKSPKWRSELEGLHDQWLGKDRVRGIWSTEEIGRRRSDNGRGAATALAVTVRTLAFARDHNLAPQQTRFSMWGWLLGPQMARAGASLSRLYDFFGDVPLTVQDNWRADIKGDVMEWVALSDLSQKRHVLVGSLLGEGAAMVARVQLPIGTAQNCPCTAVLFSPTGQREMSLKDIELGDNKTSWVRLGVEVSSNSSLVIFIGGAE